MASVSFASSARWSALLMASTCTVTAAPGGGHRGRGRRLVVRLGSNGSGIGGCHRSSGGRDRGGARNACGGEEGGPRGRELGEEHAALLLAPEARPLAQLVGDGDKDGVDGQVGGLAV